MSLYHIVDDALNQEQVNEILEFRKTTGIGSNYLFKPYNAECVLPIIDIAGQFYDLSSARYYEIWEQDNKRPNGWHYDKDEQLAVSGVLSYPLCSTIYYIEVEDGLEGGNLLIRDPDTAERHTVKPVTNRLVVFGPAVMHYVQEFTGRRHSFLCNPWDKLLGQIN